MKVIHLLCKRQVGQAIAVVGQEFFFSLQVSLHLLQALTDVGTDPRIREGDIPILNITVKQLDILGPGGQDEVVGGTLIVVQKIVFDRFRTMPQAQDKVLVPVVGIVLHYMPEDGAIADLYHRFGDVFRVTNPQSKPTAKENDFHIPLSRLRSRIKRSRRLVLRAKSPLGSDGIVRPEADLPSDWEEGRHPRKL